MNSKKNAELNIRQYYIKVRGLEEVKNEYILSLIDWLYGSNEKRENHRKIIVTSKILLSAKVLCSNFFENFEKIYYTMLTWSKNENPLDKQMENVQREALRRKENVQYEVRKVCCK